jgi:AcrR family transcriptional regulator
MVRIVKEHQVRKTQIWDVSEKLFFSKGYENTSVRDIIDQIEIAKGTFYHYFKSKEDLLDDIIKRRTEEDVNTLKEVVGRNDLDVSKKFNAFFQIFNRKNNKEWVRAMMNSSENVLVKDKLKHSLTEALSELLTKILDQGIREGTFKIGLPKQTSELILTLNFHVSESLGALMSESTDLMSGQDEIDKKIQAYEYSVSKILGLFADEVQLIDKEFINMFS